MWQRHCCCEGDSDGGEGEGRGGARSEGSGRPQRQSAPPSHAPRSPAGSVRPLRVALRFRGRIRRAPGQEVAPTLQHEAWRQVAAAPPEEYPIPRLTRRLWLARRVPRVPRRPRTSCLSFPSVCVCARASVCMACNRHVRVGAIGCTSRTDTPERSRVRAHTTQAVSLENVE